MADSISDLRKLFYGTTEAELDALRTAVAAGKTFSSLVSSTEVGFYTTDPIARQAGVADPAGGVTVDAEARAAISAIITRLENVGLIATV